MEIMLGEKVTLRYVHEYAKVMLCVKDKNGEGSTCVDFDLVDLEAAVEAFEFLRTRDELRSHKEKCHTTGSD